MCTYTRKLTNERRIFARGQTILSNHDLQVLRLARALNVREASVLEDRETFYNNEKLNPYIHGLKT